MTTNFFEVTDEHLSRLGANQLHDLLSRLLHLEAVAIGLSPTNAEVSLEIDIPDGGRDGLVYWEKGPNPQGYLPRRYCCFQSKATKKGTSTNWGAEVLTSKGLVKPEVLETCKRNGAYIGFTNHNTRRNTQISNIVKTLKRKKVPGLKNTHIDIINRSLLRDWVNKHLPAAIWVLQQNSINTGLAQSWSRWASSKRLRIPRAFIADNTRIDHIKYIRKAFTDHPRIVLRLQGLPGLGKTRLALETFNLDFSPEECLGFLHGRVVYFNEYDKSIDEIIENCILQKREALIVVDDCNLDSHRKLADRVKTTGANIGLLTIDFETARAGVREGLITMDAMEEKHITEILKQIYPDMETVLVDRVAKFAEGFPQIATLLAEAVEDSSSILELSDPHLVEKLACGRTDKNTAEGRTILKVTSALSIFERFRDKDTMDINEDLWLKGLRKIVDVSEDDIADVIKHQVQRGVFIRRFEKGRYIYLKPKPLAQKLASEWWRSKGKQKLKSIFEFEEPIITEIMKRLVTLSHVPEAREAAEYLQGPEGPFQAREVLLSERGSRIFQNLVEIDPQASVKCLKTVLRGYSVDDYKAISGSVRRHLVWALEKLVWWEETFADAAYILGEFAVGETEPFANNATNLFKQLFRIPLSGTLAPYDVREGVIDKVLSRKENTARKLGVDALLETLKYDHVHRTGGPEEQGGRLPGRDWMPKTYDAWLAIAANASESLVAVAKEDSEVGEYARNLAGKYLPSIFGSPHAFLENIAIETLRSIFVGTEFNKVTVLNSLESQFNMFAKNSSEEAYPALRELINDLQLHTTRDRIMKTVVMSTYWDHEKINGKYVDLAEEKAAELARELSDSPDIVLENIELLVIGEVRYGYRFGEELALSGRFEITAFTDSLLKLMRGQTKPLDPRLLAGYLNGLRTKGLEKQVSKTLDMIRDDSILQKHLLEITRLISPALLDIERVFDLVDNKEIDISQMNVLVYGATLRDLNDKDLIIVLNRMVGFGPGGALVAVEVGFQQLELKDRERGKDVVSVIERAFFTENLLNVSPRNTGYAWECLAKRFAYGDKTKSLWIVSEIFKETDSQSINVWISWSHSAKKVLAEIVKEYPEESWDIIGNRIIASRHLTWRLRQYIGDEVSGRKDENISSYIPEDYLMNWCKANPDEGPEILVELLEMLFGEEYDTLNPTVVKILEEYGDSDRIKSEVYSNLVSFGSTGSRIPYYSRRIAAVKKLKDSRFAHVRNWARESEKYLAKRVEHEQAREDEEGYF